MVRPKSSLEKWTKYHILIIDSETFKMFQGPHYGILDSPKSKKYDSIFIFLIFAAILKFKVVKNEQFFDTVFGDSATLNKLIIKSFFKKNVEFLLYFQMGFGFWIIKAVYHAIFKEM